MSIEGKHRLSVCMATYNGALFIKEQLDSILGQLEADDELVVSDDSSTDSTVEIIRNCSDPRIRLLEGNTFYNTIFNFENALRHATGDVIVLSDQDDVWLPNKVAVIRERFALKAAPVYLLVLDAEVIDEEGHLLCPSLFKKFRRVGPGVAANIFDNAYIGCCMAFSRELLHYALPFPRQIPMHDVWLGLLAELYGTSEFVPVTTLRYRKHRASATDFGIRFVPWTQITRRFWLAWSLAGRYIARRSKKYFDMS